MQAGGLIQHLAGGGRRVGAVFRFWDGDMEMAARILDKLRQSPLSVEELAFELKRKAVEVRLLINALVREGSIVKLDTDREGGPFYTPVGYVEPADRLDNCVLAGNKREKCKKGSLALASERRAA